MLQIYRDTLSEKYLGLPTAAGRITEQLFEYIIGHSRVQGYCEKKMSCAAKEALLKSIIQALPTFFMSCFKFTKVLCKKIMTPMSKYWWAGSLDKRGMH